MSEKPVTINAPALVLPPEVKVDPPKVGDRNIAPKTTASEDLVTAGQRRINILWELTQAIVAIMVTGFTLYVAATLAISGSGDVAAFLLLSNAFFAVITAYLTRTNHTKTGGVQDEKRRGE